MCARRTGETGTEPGVYLTNGYYSSGFFTSTWSDALLASQGGQGGLFTALRKPQNNLKPENQREFETGVDFGFLKDRADASFTYYDRKAHDVIFDLPLAASTGYNVQASQRRCHSQHGHRSVTQPPPDSHHGLRLGSRLPVRAQQEQGARRSRGAEAVDLPTGGFFTGTLVSAVRGYPIGVFRSYDFVRCRNGTPNSVDVDGSGTPTDINAACAAAKAPNGALYIGPDGFPVAGPDAARHWRPESELDGRCSHGPPLAQGHGVGPPRHPSGWRDLERHAEARSTTSGRRPRRGSAPTARTTRPTTWRARATSGRSVRTS